MFRSTLCMIVAGVLVLQCGNEAKAQTTVKQDALALGWYAWQLAEADDAGVYEYGDDYIFNGIVYAYIGMLENNVEYHNLASYNLYLAAMHYSALATGAQYGDQASQTISGNWSAISIYATVGAYLSSVQANGGLDASITDWSRVYTQVSFDLRVTADDYNTSFPWAGATVPQDFLEQAQLYGQDWETNNDYLWYAYYYQASALADPTDGIWVKLDEVEAMPMGTTDRDYILARMKQWEAVTFCASVLNYHGFIWSLLEGL